MIFRCHSKLSARISANVLSTGVELLTYCRCPAMVLLDDGREGLGAAILRWKAVTRRSCWCVGWLAHG